MDNKTKPTLSVKVCCLNRRCLHSQVNGDCKRGYIELDVMGMCDSFILKEPSGRKTNIEYECAKDLAINLWKKHYRKDAPGWEPCDDLMGVLTQIDNMICELVKK